MATTTIAITVAMNVAIIHGIKILVASFEFAMMRCAMMLMGVSVNPDACSTMNMIWGLLAVSLFGFTSCKLCIAFKPNGVAALSNPSRLAEKFIIMCPIAGWFFGSSGNSLLKNGPTMRERNPIAPARSPIFMNPRNRLITPINPIEISTLVLAVAKTASTMVLKMSVFPWIANLTIAATKARRKNEIQMMLSAIGIVKG